MEQGPNKQSFYVHEVEIKEKLSNVFKTSTEGGTRQASRSILAQRANEVNTLLDNGSKVVDENGEPMVVYHGTRSAFTVFDRSKSGESNKYARVGFWFSPIKGFGERFTWNSWWGDGEEREMSLFLNVRNPKVFETRADEDYGDAYERFRTDVVALLEKDAADKTGGKVMMRPANDENGLATKKPSTAKDKANRDYRGDISRVVDLIGGTCVMRADGDFYDAVKAIRKMLATPEFKGCSVAKVKKLGFETMAPQYRDIKVSVRFANGGIGEIILVEETINDAKFNRGGHDIYDVMRELDPLRDNNKLAASAHAALKELSALVYQSDEVVDAESFALSKSKASSALDALRPLQKSLSSSLVAILVKSSDSLLKKAKPASVYSAAMPSRSLIQNISNTILTDSVGLSTIISL